MFFKLFKNKNFLPLIAVIFFGVLAGRSLIFESGYFNMHDDLQMMRQLELEKCIEDGQIPCRWVPDMGFGYGFPLYNFYPPLPYLVGQIFRIVGFSFVVTAKLTFALSFILSGVAMYFLSKNFFGRLGGVLSAVFYIWAPYHSVDVYVRGAMNEAWALVWFPLIFLFAHKLIRSENKFPLKWIVSLTISYALLMLTHNLMLMIFTPFFGLWVLINIIYFKSWPKVLPLLFSGLWALGISAFFTIPAFMESEFTQIKGQLVGYYDYSVHFVSLKQLLFSTFWGYGPSVWLEEDRMSFQIGYLHWILSIFIGVIAGLSLLKALREKQKPSFYLLSTIFLIAIGWISAFMTHSRATPLYLTFPPLGYLQFSWRFLTLVIFGFSFAVGYLSKIFSAKNKLFNFALAPLRLSVTTLLTILILISSWNYFKPEYGRMGPLTDEEKFSGRAWMLQQTAGIYDYLPNYAKEAPKEAQQVLAEVVGGEASISDFNQGTYWGKFKSEVPNESATVRINILNFPGWKVFVDGKETNVFMPPSEKWGRMWVDIPNGNHEVYVQLFNTPVRTTSNIVSLVSLLVLFVAIIKFRKEAVV